MTIYWDEKILDVWNSIQTRRQLAEMEEQQVQLTLAECLDGVQKGYMEYEGRRFEFEEKVLFDGQLGIQLPRSMQLMPRGRGSNSAGNHQHEQLTYKEENSEVMLGMNHMAHLLPMSGVESFVQAMTAQIKKAQAGLQVVHNELIEQDGCRVACSEFIIPVEDKTYYQILFATSVNGRALLGSFHFESEEVLVWQPLAHALIRTLRVEQNVNMT
ncbi:hypothetical protein [Brevibacillus porteri]|uniref:Uncharacterized protein n=1 Tax=Brevibacillus porteri TaxID=2126350 RepID=A0ABX5FRR2_9BACL|nr:hypothetical protein [Brevibacillus porteri]MED1798069.1 hypothetical protein [Brevibacillus porteri]MED2132096.1 hypothetical protein [Brevibacillus porteri]MED2742659.1 hypothetical protein [Brevibacillus porteri]MED2814135.1 hypothetical protein [Brevibacillus porteri]MED2893696.1 hypothetical protein [Brevibacillus porteri]